MTVSRCKKIQNPNFYELLGAAEHNVFRLEAMDDYDVPQEDGFCREYAAGTPVARIINGMPDAMRWYEFMERLAKEGRPSLRIRALPRRPSKYIRQELDIFQFAVDHGEDIRVLIKEQNSDIKTFWDSEFYVLDDSRVLYVKYDENNKYIGVEEETDSDCIIEKVRQRDTLIKRSVPFSQFLGHLRTSAILEIPDIRTDLASSSPTGI